MTDEPLTEHIVDQWFDFWRHHLTKQGRSMANWKARTVDRIREAAVAGLSRRWIPVSERFPSPGVGVLCANRHCRFVAWLSVEDGGGSYWESNDKVNLVVTHWMPLPCPPTT